MFNLLWLLLSVPVYILAATFIHIGMGTRRGISDDSLPRRNWLRFPLAAEPKGAENRRARRLALRVVGGLVGLCGNQPSSRT